MNPMKRNLLMAGLCLLCALLLIGCGSSAPANTPTATAPSAPVESAVPAESPAPTPEASAPVETSEPAPSAAPAAVLPDAGLVPDTETEPSAAELLFELAKSYIEKPLSELQAEIGEPVSSTYVSSCLVPGGQDGELHYDGFTVYTLKSGDSETVQDVLAD